jgi:hypothetical protein
MTDHKGQAVSPYLMKPLRSFQQALAEQQQQLAVQHDSARSARNPARETHYPADAAKAVTRALSRVA